MLNVKKSILSVVLFSSLFFSTQFLSANQFDSKVNNSQVVNQGLELDEEEAFLRSQLEKGIAPQGVTVFRGGVENRFFEEIGRALDTFFSLPKIPWWPW